MARSTATSGSAPRAKRAAAKPAGKKTAGTKPAAKARKTAAGKPSPARGLSERKRLATIHAPYSNSATCPGVAPSR